MKTISPYTNVGLRSKYFCFDQLKDMLDKTDLHIYAATGVIGNHSEEDVVSFELWQNLAIHRNTYVLAQSIIDINDKFERQCV